MKIYRAIYSVAPFKRDIDDFFEFQLKEHDDWEKHSSGYRRHDGWLSDYVENEIEIYNSLCYVCSTKYFEHELTEEEIKELKVKMQMECIKALEIKRDKSYKEITAQIDFIKGRIE